MAEIELFEAINSLRQITRYTAEPVPREAIERIIEAATRAPSGGNRQPWEFIAILDRGLIEKVGRLYREAWMEALGATPAPDESPVYRAARYLAEHMAEVPALILVCADHTQGSAPYTPGEPLVRGRYASSIWLAVQNLFLAARALGLGTRLTTAHLRREAEIKALLAIPEHVETMALIPVGYPRGRFGPPLRRPAREVTSYNRYGNRA
ncbi:MAG TPA: nitroreductase family protein [Dehalococcoidia bacterium]|nr:nitroreductase family protein [Dehalococcoidia bacterium]